MVNEIKVTLLARLTADPEIRYTQAGVPVVNFNLASNSRKFDKNSSEWKDNDPTFLRASAWRQLAENCANTLTKGMEVVVHGTYVQRPYEKDGEKRTSHELEIEYIGPSLQWATAQVMKNEKGQGGGAPQQQGYQQQPAYGQQQGYGAPQQQGYPQQGGPAQQAPQGMQQPPAQRQPIGGQDTWSQPDGNFSNDVPW